MFGDECLMVCVTATHFFLLSFALPTVFCYDSRISMVLFLCCTRHYTFTYIITVIKEGVVFLGHSPLCCDMLV